MAKTAHRKGSRENPITGDDIKNLAKKIAGRDFTILKALLKDDLCNYKYEIISGIGIGDSHNVDGAGIIKDELREAFGKLHVHLATLDGIFKAAGVEITDIDTCHEHEFSLMYRVESFEIKGRKELQRVCSKINTHFIYLQHTPVDHIYIVIIQWRQVTGIKKNFIIDMV